MTDVRLSPAQRYQIDKLKGKTLMAGEWDRVAKEWCWMPYMTEVRTYEALERKGYVVYKSVGPGIALNGYRLTDAGQAA